MIAFASYVARALHTELNQKSVHVYQYNIYRQAEIKEVLERLGVYLKMLPTWLAE